MYLPALERNVELVQRYLECFEPAQERYDTLLDDYERDMKTADVRAIFDVLKQELVPLIAELRSRDDPSLADVVNGDFPVERQREISHEVVNMFGFRNDSWRLDPTVHPFASGGGVDDIRLTTNYNPSSLESLMATMHEYGHGLYEHQVARELDRTPLGSGVSLGLHESQSRMWENLVGRSLPFWRFFYGRLQQAFPQQLGDVDVERFYRAVNRVTPSLIRIHADEVTYNLHVILRFELEQDIIERRVDLSDLPNEWNRRMEEYLGVEVPSSRRGCCKTCTGPAARSATSRPTRSATSSRCRSGSVSCRTSRTCTSASSGGSSRRSGSGSASGCTGTGASSRPPRRWPRWSAGRSTRGLTCATCAKSTSPARRRSSAANVPSRGARGHRRRWRTRSPTSCSTRLHEWGVRRIFGYPGDGINGIMGALDRARDRIEFVQVRHEEMAAFMACAHAKFTGEVGVCLATSGPGAIHLLNGLYDAKLDHQPVVAIVGQQARAALGGGYQQEVDLLSLFKDVADEYVQMATDPEQVRHLVDRAMRIALAERTVTCVIVPNDVQKLDAVERRARARDDPLRRRLRGAARGSRRRATCGAPPRCSTPASASRCSSARARSARPTR